jgi:hypothetical protein
MARTLQLSVPADQTDLVLNEIKSIDGVIGIRIRRGSSIKPPGDVLELDTTSNGLLAITKALDRRGLHRRSDFNLTISSPDATVSPTYNHDIRTDFSDGTWEEIECEIASESNMSINAIWVMGLAGVLAAVGIATNSLHTVIGAMVIAPGFEPILRIPLALVARGASWKHGLGDTLKGYGALLLAAAATAWLLQLPPSLSMAQSSDYLEPGALVKYWTTLSVTSVIVTIAAAIAGALIVAMKRSVLTAGVMIALALIPTASLVAMALVVGNLDLMQQAAIRWAVDAGAVCVAGLAIFFWKRLRVQRRSTWL